MHFCHSGRMWAEYPELVPGTAAIHGFVHGPSELWRVEPRLHYWTREAEHRLIGKTEAELPEIQAWRRAYPKMGLKPTQYHCASEALLRRLRKEGSLPRVQPLVSTCAMRCRRPTPCRWRPSMWLGSTGIWRSGTLQGRDLHKFRWRRGRGHAPVRSP